MFESKYLDEISETTVEQNAVGLQWGVAYSLKNFKQQGVIRVLLHAGSILSGQAGNLQ